MTQAAKIMIPDRSVETVRERALAVALAAVLLLTALAFGGVHLWASALFELAVWSLALVWLLLRLRSSSRSPELGTAAPRAVLLAGVALCSYLSFQILPLPPALLARLSPAAATTRAISERALERIPGPASAVSSGGESLAADPVAERIDDLAGSSAATFWRRWQPIALYPFAATADLLRYLAYLTAFYLAATLPAPRLVVRAAVLSGFTVALVALAQFATWNGHILWVFDPYDRPVLGDTARFCGPFVNASHFSLFVVMTLAPGVALAAEAWKRLRRRRRLAEGLRSAMLPGLLLGTGFAVMIGGIVGSSSRGGLTATVLAMGVVWWGTREPLFAAIRSTRPRAHASRANPAWDLTRRVGPIVIAAAIVVAGLTIVGPSSRKALDVRLEEAVTAPDLRIRLDLWTQTVPMLRDFAWVGTGAAGWAEAFPRYVHYPMVQYGHNHAHNDYIEWATEVGLVGIVLTFLVVVSLGWWSASNPSLPRVIRWGLGASLLAAAWQELFDFGLRVPANALLVALLSGSLCNRYWKESSSPLTARPAGRTGRGAILLAGVTACVVWSVLSFASVRQLREFLQWARVRHGSTHLSFTPRDAETWERLGGLLADQGSPSQATAARCFRAALWLRPARGEPLWRLSKITAEKTSSDAAMRAALALAPAQTEWRLQHARALDLEGRPAEALTEIEEAAFHDPRGSEHRYLDSLTPALRPIFLPAVEHGLLRALDERPDDPLLLDEVASFYFRFDAWRQAGDLWKRAAELSSDWAYLGRYAAQGYAAAGDFAQAEGILRRGIAQKPTEADLYRRLAMTVYRPQTRYREAEETLERGAHRALDRGWIYLDLSALQADQGKRDDSLRSLETAGKSSLRNAALQLAVGKAYLAAQNDEQAKLAFDVGLRADPRRADLHHEKGVALERLYDLQGAHGEYAKALELEPGNPRYGESFERVDQEFRIAKTRPAPQAVVEP